MNLYTFQETLTNSYSSTLLSALSILSIMTAVYVIIIKNPITSVMFLIGLFLSIAVYLIIIGHDFIGFSYILVYVGAISILFLFILMLINIRVSELSTETNNSIPLIFFVTIFFAAVSDKIYTWTDSVIISNFNWEDCLTTYDNINSIAKLMYTSHGIWLILASIILLLAMVGTIVITIKPKIPNFERKQLTLPSSIFKLPLRAFIVYLYITLLLLLYR